MTYDEFKKAYKTALTDFLKAPTGAIYICSPESIDALNIVSGLEDDYPALHRRFESEADSKQFWDSI